MVKRLLSRKVITDHTLFILFYRDSILQYLLPLLYYSAWILPKGLIFILYFWIIGVHPTFFSFLFFSFFLPFFFYFSFFLFSSIPHLVSLSVNAVKEFFEYSYSILSIGVGKYGLEITSLSESYLDNYNLFCSSMSFIDFLLCVLHPSR